MFQSKKSDPRVIRTRNLIQDAFFSLATEKDFDLITVKDIADKATVNRATFYAHFEDKYALLDNLVSDAFTKSLSDRIKPDADLTKETIEELILVIFDYHDSINYKCKRVHRSAIALIDSKVQSKLNEIIINLLMNKKTYPNAEMKKLKTRSVMISHSIYSATSQWYSEGKFDDKSELLAVILSFVMAGIEAMQV